MKYRKIALCLASLVLVGVFYVLQRSAEPEISKTSISETPDGETVASKSESDLKVGLDPPEKAPNPQLTEPRRFPPSEASYGNPIPFESLTMSELEEVDLARPRGQNRI